MLCDGCKKNEASIVLHMVTNGQVATRSLCPDCAQKAHGEMTRAFTTMGLQMEGLQGMVEQQAQREEIRIPRMICASCRSAYEEIDDTTVFGCPQCYGAFEEQVVGYLSSIRPKEEIIPEAARMDTAIPVPTREELEHRLNEAISSEDYEEAAALRDRLRTLAQENTDV